MLLKPVWTPHFCRPAVQSSSVAFRMGAEGNISPKRTRRRPNTLAMRGFGSSRQAPQQRDEGRVGHPPRFFASEEADPLRMTSRPGSHALPTLPAAPSGFPLDETPSLPVRFLKFALRSRPWISCRVAEGRALRSHDNRIGRELPVARCQLSPYTGGT